MSNDAAAFALATDRMIASPERGFRRWAPTRPVTQPKPPACYRASWQLPGPDSHRQATTSFRPEHDPGRSPPDHWAHACSTRGHAARVSCPEHGIGGSAIGQARCGYTFAVDDTVAWLATPTSKSAGTELMRIAWRTVGSIIARVWADTETLDVRCHVAKVDLAVCAGHRRGVTGVTAVTGVISGRGCCCVAESGPGDSRDVGRLGSAGRGGRRDHRLRGAGTQVGRQAARARDHVPDAGVGVVPR